MINIKILPVLSLVFTGVLCLAQNKVSEHTDTEKEGLRPLTFTAEAAPEWTALMERTSGWFGADGIFSIPLDGNETQGIPNRKTLFIFSDTYIGEVVNGEPKPGNVMVNNSLAWMTGNKPKSNAISFAYKKNADRNPTSYFVPSDSLTKEGEYYWLGDGFVNQEKNNTLYIFAYHVHKTGPNVFDFEQTNISLLKIKNPTEKGISDFEQIPTQLGFVHPSGNRVYFGSGIFVNTKEAGAPNPDGFVYVYGVLEGNKSLIAARTLPKNIENFNTWTFWDGKTWNKEKNSVDSLADGVSNELSVTPTDDGRYLLTYTILGISDKIGIQVGESPVGPFGKVQEVYTCPEYKEKDLLPYNAKAHYHLSKPGELLISYNTITYNFWKDIQQDATIYHPRFIKVKYK